MTTNYQNNEDTSVRPSPTALDQKPRNHRYGSIPNVTQDETVENLPMEDFQRKRMPSWVLPAVAGMLFVTMVLGLSGYFGHTGQEAFDSSALPASLRYQDEGRGHKYKHHKESFLLKEKNDEKSLYYKEQFLDHINVDTEHGKNLKVYTQRYYKKSKYWKGPGFPILVILGGEDELDLPMLYPFVHEGLAKKFGAFVLSPEHRFYGESQPIRNPTVEEMIRYLTPDQALLDTVNLIQYIRDQLGCSTDRTSDQYCPVITVGGSYPGFLSTMMRFRFPDIVDIGYASSAPLELYSQVVDSDAYFDKVTEVADVASAGCSNSIRDTLFAVQEELLASTKPVKHIAESVGFCPKTLPRYFDDVETFVSEAIIFLVPAIFADFNMAFYPPGAHTALGKACEIFQNEKYTPLEKMSKFFDLRGEVEYGEEKPKCFDLSLELPTGHHSRIRGADNSGSGGGFTGEIWEFQCCKDLIIRAGYSPESMFIPRHFSYEWHEKHCQERFPGVPVEPFRMVNQWHFDDLSHTSHILFTNGLNDGWSTSSILQTDNPNLAVVNFPNGAHHSELGQVWPNPKDTEDVKAGYDTIITILGQWLNEIYAEQATSTR